MKIFHFRDVWPQLANLILRRRFRFDFELIPYRAENLSWRKIGNFFLAGLNQYLPRPRPFGKPVFAQVEPANFCNLSCPLCLTVSESHARPAAVLPFDVFRRFIDEVGDTLLLIVFWNWGEPFLNPDLCRMLACAKAKGILTHCSTNGNVRFDEEKAREIVRSGLDTLIFGVDGATPETYAKYRVGGDFNRVLDNIRTLLRVRKELGSATPRINLRFVVMSQNEVEIPRITEIARELGVDFFTLKTVDMPADLGDQLDSCYAPSEQKYRRYEYEETAYVRKSRRFRCIRPWKRITLDATGTVIACEYDYRNGNPFGSIASGDSALSVWKSPAAQVFRRGFRFGWNDCYFCANCTLKNRVAEDCTIERIPLD